MSCSQTYGRLEYEIIGDEGICDLRITSFIDGKIDTVNLKQCAIKSVLCNVIRGIIKSDRDREQIMYMIDDEECKGRTVS